MGLLSFLFSSKKKIYKNVDNGINQIKHGVYTRLSRRYAETYGEDKADLLAAAVTNELFSLPPSNDFGKAFLAENKKTVEKELGYLKDDNDIKMGVTHAIRIRMSLIYSSQKSGDYDKSLGKPYTNLVRRGLANQNAKDLEPRAFIRFAEKFYQLSIR